MPNYLLQSLGKTGEMVERNSQDYVVKHLYINKGACLSICAKFMCEIKNLNLPTEKDYIETAQWIQERPDHQSRVNLLANAAGLKQVGLLEGSLIYDEIMMGPFFDKVSSRPSFNIFCFANTQRDRGHAILLYTWEGSGWVINDPNFGMAKWPNTNGALLGLKRLLNSAYGDFGPYYRFWIHKYE